MTKKLNCFELGAWELFGTWDSLFGILAAAWKFKSLGRVRLRIEIMVCPLGQLIQTILQENSFLLEMGPVPILIDLNRFSPDEYTS